MSVLTVDDIELLRAQEDIQLIDWYIELNRWGWPAEIADPEEQKFSLGDNGRRGHLMAYIRGVVGTKAILKRHNEDTMSPEEFEAWWDTVGYCGL